MIFLVFFTRKYYFPKFSFKIKIDKKLKFFFKKLLPSIFSSGVTQINILVGTIIASFQASAVSYLYYADRIYQINLAIAGIAIGTVLLPSLSKYVEQNNLKKIKFIQNKSLELSLFLCLPATFALLISSEEITSALFGYGSFDYQSKKFIRCPLLLCHWTTCVCFNKSFFKLYFCKTQYPNSFYIFCLFSDYKYLYKSIFFQIWDL